MMNGYQQYKQQSVGTMTSGEMLTLLFDGAIKNVTSAGLALERSDAAAFELSLSKAEKIIRYLSTTLNMNYDISKDLYRLYDYFLYELSRLRAGQNKEIVQEIKKMLTELRDTFKEADRLASNKGTPAQTPITHSEPVAQTTAANYGMANYAAAQGAYGRGNVAE